MKRNFMVKAVWDDKANVFYSESDIEGLHIEAVTIAEFEEIMMDVAPDLIVTNHLSAPDIAEHPLKDLIPAILWQREEDLICSRITGDYRPGCFRSQC